jgi:glutaredoxin-related protein
LDGDNIIQLDLNWMCKQCYLLWNSLQDKRTKVTMEYDNVLVTMSENKFNSFIKAQDKWIDMHNVEPTGINILLRLAK